MTSIRIRRFGPITDGEIDISPLTILIGPNGSGKSYAAMLLHSLSKETRRNFPLYVESRDLDNLSDSEAKRLEEIRHKLNSSGESTLDKNIANKVSENYFKNYLSKNINDNLESVFATQLNDLIKDGSHRSFRFDIHGEFGHSQIDFYSSYENVQVKDWPKFEQDVSLVHDSYLEESSNITAQEYINKKESPTIVVYNQRLSGDVLLPSIFHYLRTRLNLRYNGSSHYLPAGRAGLLQSHEVLTTGAFDRLSRVGLEPIEVPAFSGVVSSYISQIVELTGKEEGELSHLANQIENKALKGEVQVETRDQQPHPKITFSKKHSEFPLHLASTSVSELSPLILYTRYVLSNNSVIVIEEPEAHLHPENQRLVAFFIIKLVQEGVRVIVTTHSDFFIEQLNNSIRISKVPEEKKAKEGLEDLPSLDPDSVSVQMFQQDNGEQDGSIGYKIRQMTVDGVGGIPLDEFEEVSDSLYGQSYKVDKLLQESINKR